MRPNTYFLVNVQNLTIFADIKCPTFGKASAFMHDSIFFGDLFSGIAENRIVQVERFREFCIDFVGIAACGENCNIEFTKRFTTLTE